MEIDRKKKPEIVVFAGVEEDIICIVRILHMLVDSKAWLYRTFGNAIDEKQKTI